MAGNAEVSAAAVSEQVTAVELPSQSQMESQKEASSSAAEPETAANGKTKKRSGKTKAEAAVKLRPEDNPKLSWTFKKIPADELFVPGKDRSEEDEKEFERLVASVGKLGILEPLPVRFDKDMGKYAIVAGKRRFRAHLAAGIKDPVPCHVIEEQVIPGQDPLIALTENALREKMSPYDQAKLWAAVLKQTGWTQEELAQHYGIAKGRVSEYLKLLKVKLSKEAKAKLARGELSAKAVSRAIDSEGNYNPELAATSNRKHQPKEGGNNTSSYKSTYVSWCDKDTGITLIAEGSKKKLPPIDTIISSLKRWLSVLEATDNNQAE
jgi:ParB/RepB/Spo0J family partition protein